MQFEVVAKDSLSTELQDYLEFRFAPLWEALKTADAIRVPLNGLTAPSVRASLAYAAKKTKNKVRVLISKDKKSVIVVKA